MLEGSCSDCHFELIEGRGLGVAAVVQGSGKEDGGWDFSIGDVE